MIIYFIAMTPYIEKSVNNKIYFTYGDAVAALDFIALLPPYTWKIFQAEVINIHEEGAEYVATLETGNG